MANGETLDLALQEELAFLEEFTPAYTGSEIFDDALLASFLNPNIRYSTEQQLDLMRSFWGALGIEMPTLSPSQDESLHTRLPFSSRPDLRVIPTLLMDNGDRQATVEKASQVFPRSKFSKENGPFWMPHADGPFPDIWTLPDHSTLSDQLSHTLGYKTSESTIVPREEYIGSLLESGQAVQDESGRVWIFPIVNIKRPSRRSEENAFDKYDSVSPIAVPEIAITLELLHQANGSDNNQHTIFMTNEAILQVDSSGKPLSFERVVGVGWHPENEQIDVYPWGLDVNSPEFEPLEAISGI